MANESTIKVPIDTSEFDKLFQKQKAHQDQLKETIELWKKARAARSDYASGKGGTEEVKDVMDKTAEKSGMISKFWSNINSTVNTTSKTLLSTFTQLVKLVPGLGSFSVASLAGVGSLMGLLTALPLLVIGMLTGFHKLMSSQLEKIQSERITQARTGLTPKEQKVLQATYGEETGINVADLAAHFQQAALNPATRAATEAQLGLLKGGQGLQELFQQVEQGKQVMPQFIMALLKASQDTEQSGTNGRIVMGQLANTVGLTTDQITVLNSNLVNLDTASKNYAEGIKKVQDLNTKELSAADNSIQKLKLFSAEIDLSGQKMATRMIPAFDELVKAEESVYDGFANLVNDAIPAFSTAIHDLADFIEKLTGKSGIAHTAWEDVKVGWKAIEGTAAGVGAFFGTRSALPGAKDAGTARSNFMQAWHSYVDPAVAEAMQSRNSSSGMPSLGPWKLGNRISPAQSEENKGIITDYLRGQGVDDQHIQAILNNLKIESGFNPSAVNPDSGAYGIMQWLGSRKTEEQAFERNHPELNSLQAQLAFMMQEAKGGEKSGWESFLSAKGDTSYLTGLFAQKEERPGDAEVARRYTVGKNGKQITIPYDPSAAINPRQGTPVSITLYNQTGSNMLINASQVALAG